jgi:two-component system sensor histidine kinase QseC
MVLIASIAGILTHRHVRIELDELYNANLQQVARLMVSKLERDDLSSFNTPPQEPPIRIDWEEGDYLIQVWSREGGLISQETSAITQGFSRKIIHGESWRIYRADGPHVIVQIAQPESARLDAIQEISAQLLGPLVLQVSPLILVVWVSVRYGLMPLDMLSKAHAERTLMTWEPFEGALSKAQPRRWMYAQACSDVGRIAVGLLERATLTMQ